MSAETQTPVDKTPVDPTLVGTTAARTERSGP